MFNISYYFLFWIYKIKIFVFVIDVYTSASKIDISRAIESVFDVKVVSVNTFNVKGKTRRVGRNLAKKPDRKRAIVTLQSGDSIQLVEGT